MSLKMAHKVIVPQKKIMSRSLLNSGTLIVIVKCRRNYFGGAKKKGRKQKWRRPLSLIPSTTTLGGSNGNASETKVNESFDNGVFFDIEAKRTPLIVSKLFSKRSEHIR
jgi:hypothetical protein